MKIIVPELHLWLKLLIDIPSFHVTSLPSITLITLRDINESLLLNFVLSELVVELEVLKKIITDYSLPWNVPPVKFLHMFHVYWQQLIIHAQFLCKTFLYFQNSRQVVFLLYLQFFFSGLWCVINYILNSRRKGMTSYRVSCKQT